MPIRVLFNIDLSLAESVDSVEISRGVVVDYDTSGKVTGIDINYASETLDLNELVTSHLPVKKQAMSA